jgi:hypothetical protein
LDRNQFVKTLIFLSSLLSNDGKLILVYESIYDSENGTSEKSLLIERIELYFRRIYRKMFYRRNLGQGWGWARDNKITKELISLAGFSNIFFYAEARQSIVIIQK